MEVVQNKLDLKIKEEVVEITTDVSTASGESQNVCQYCYERFKFKRLLEEHYSKTHPQQLPFSCINCNISFKTTSGLRKHKRRRGCLCLKTFDFVCRFCQLRFQYQISLDAHYKISHKEKMPYSCSCCNKPFKTFNSLRKHCLSRQRGKIFACVWCEKSFSYSDNLKVHVMRAHTNIRPYVCNYCEKAFAEKAQLGCHIRTHTGEKPFCCVTCGRCFAERNSLKAHIRHHTGEKPYTCSECGKCLVSSSALSRHKIIHTREKKHQCARCKKQFARSDYLKLHIKCHCEKG